MSHMGPLNEGTGKSRDPFTYHVGWKKGEIRSRSEGEPPSVVKRILQWMLRSVPYPTEKAWKTMLIIMLPLVFAGLCAAAYLLSSAHIG